MRDVEKGFISQTGKFLLWPVRRDLNHNVEFEFSQVSLSNL